MKNSFCVATRCGTVTFTSAVVDDGGVVDNEEEEGGEEEEEAGTVVMDVVADGVLRAASIELNRYDRRFR